jgi:peptide/nickel transport system substrate-binding protein
MSERGNLFGGRLLAVIAMSAIVVGACGSNSASPAASAAASTGASEAPGASSAVPMGGSVSFRLGADVSTWDPCVNPAATVPGVMGDPLNAVYGSLVYTDVDGVVQPGMAESLTTEDAITWTFKLRDGVKFTDGTAYDAEALKYNFDRATKEENACTSGKWIATWASTTAVDPLTFQVKLPTADGNFNLKIAELAAFIASPTALAAAATPTDIKPVGAGPFVLGTWEQGVKTVLKKNADYWDAPRPYIDEYVLMTIPESNTGQNMIVQGGLDMMMGYAYQYGANATQPGVATQVVPINGYNIAYFINDGGTTGLFNNVKARQAVALGVERAKWVEALTQDPSIKAPVAMYPETSPYFDSSLVYPALDATKAQALIDEVIASGTLFEFTILVPNSSDTVRAAQYLQQAMSAYKGVTVNVNTVDGKVYNQECLAKNGDICIQPGASMWNSPEPNTFNLLSSVGSQPFAAYSSEAMDAALDKTLSAVSDADRMAAYKEVQTVFIADMPFIQYGTQTRTMLLRDDVAGVVHGGQGRIQPQYLYRCDGKCTQ